MIAEAGDRDCPGAAVQDRAGAGVRDQVRGGLLRIRLLQVLPPGNIVRMVETYIIDILIV